MPTKRPLYKNGLGAMMPKEIAARPAPIFTMAYNAGPGADSSPIR